MTEKKNISLITVLTTSAKNPTLDVIHVGSLQKTTGNALLPNMPVNDTTMNTQVGTLQTTYNGFKAVPPIFTEAQVTAKKNIVVASYNQNAGYIQGIARAAAIAAGDVNAGLQLVNASGYKVKKSKSATTRAFSVTNAGEGAVEITTKAVATHAGYIRQYGTTSAKGAPPTADTIQEPLFSVEVSVVINNLKSNTIYAFREASILPVGRKANTGTPTTDVQKAATPTTANKAHKAVFTDGVASHYNWSEWKYIVIS